MNADPAVQTPNRDTTAWPATRHGNVQPAVRERSAASSRRRSGVRVPGQLTSSEGGSCHFGYTAKLESVRPVSAGTSYLHAWFAASKSSKYATRRRLFGTMSKDTRRNLTTDRPVASSVTRKRWMMPFGCTSLSRMQTQRSRPIRMGFGNPDMFPCYSKLCSNSPTPRWTIED
jgi:hypothetical protein